MASGFKTTGLKMFQVALLLFSLFMLTTAKSGLWLHWASGLPTTGMTQTFGVGSGLGGVILSLALLSPLIRQRLDLSPQKCVLLDMSASVLLVLLANYFGPSMTMLLIVMAINTILTSCLIGNIIKTAITTSGPHFIQSRSGGTIGYVVTTLALKADDNSGAYLVVVAYIFLLLLTGRRQLDCGSEASNQTENMASRSPLMNKSLTWILVIGVATSCSSKSFEAYGFPMIIRSPSATWGIVLLGIFEITFLAFAKQILHAIDVVKWNLFAWVMVYSILLLFPRQSLLFALPFGALNCLATTNLMIAGECAARRANVQFFQLMFTVVNSLTGMGVILMGTFTPLPFFGDGLLVAVGCLCIALIGYYKSPFGGKRSCQLLVV